MTTYLTTPQLLLRPLTLADADAIETLVFQDSEVAKWLAYDVSVPGNSRRFAEDWCQRLAVDGDNDIWTRGGYGAFAITDRYGKFAEIGSVLGIIGFYGADRVRGKWQADLFYALGRAFQGFGLMAEASRSALDAWSALEDAGNLTAVYWHRLNHNSARVLTRLGFIDKGNISVVRKYGRRAHSFYRCELWRIQSAPLSDLARITREAAIRIGHLAFENVVSHDEALSNIRRAVATHGVKRVSDSDIAEAFQLGASEPGLKCMKFEVPRVAWKVAARFANIGRLRMAS